MREHSFVAEFRNFIHQHNLINNGDRIIVAISGGIDSMVLLHILMQLKNEFKLELTGAHFNHMLRNEESDADEAFVKKVAEKSNIPLYTERANTKQLANERKCSVQEVARDLRLEFFTKLRRSIGYQKIATAHHADDNAETILFNLFRGAGVEGLSGIPIYRSDLNIIRPLLFARRSKIEDYAKEFQIQYREDSSNNDINYSRNSLRNIIIPQILKYINPNLVNTLQRTGEIFNTLAEFLREETRRRMSEIVISQTKNEIVFDSKKFNMMPNFIQEFVLLQTAKEFSKSEIEFASVKAMQNIATAETGSFCNVKNDIVFYVDRDTIRFKRNLPHTPFCYQIELNKEYNFNEFSFSTKTVDKAEFTKNPNVEYINADNLTKDIFIRSWHQGDWFIPLGMKDKKKISDFFIEQKVPLFEKNQIPILVSSNDIVWICGYRLDERYKVTNSTRNILKLEYTPHQ